MKKFFLLLIILLSFKSFTFAKENESVIDNLFHIDQMNSYDENFALYFKTRKKAIFSAVG